MNKLLTNFDGSGRDLRPLQTAALKYVQSTCGNKVVAMTLPTGAGKTGIGVALINHYRGVYIVPYNALMDELIKVYPHINYVKGKDHYVDPKEYSASVERMLNGEPTFANPFSYRNAKFRDPSFVPNMVVYDEGDLLIDVFQMMGGTSISKTKHGSPEDLTPKGLVGWMNGVISEKIQDRAVEGLTYEEKDVISNEINSLVEVRNCILEEPHIYVSSETRNRVDISPIRPPRELVNGFFDGIRSVMMSATLTEFKLKEILQERKVVHEIFDAPIPPENRLVSIEPAPFKMNYKTPMKHVAAWIRSKQKKYPGRNTIVHLTYGNIKELQEFFPEAICITKEGKTEQIDEFKEKGGLLLAAACNQGIDFKYDQCRLNLIPRLIKPNLMSDVVKKRKGLEDGDSWYSHEVVDMLIQQAGRSTRSVTDESITVVGDGNLKYFMNPIKDEVNKDFLASVKWGRR